MTKRSTKKRVLSAADWEQLPDDEILQMRIRDLGLTINGSLLEEPIAGLHEELGQCGIEFRPPCYLADEWLCPDKIPKIGIPFCLAHQRLKHIEQKMMFEVEGGTPTWCMKLLRHECGHAINYAYRLYSRTRWRELFGRFSEKYSNSYSTRPYSKRYVLHLAEHYAQAHPDEDFAETFAVWLEPGSDWRERYCDWPVLRKLEYVERLVSKIGRVPPLVSAPAHQMPWSSSRMRMTLAAYYKRKREYLGDDFPGYYDPWLERIFTGHGAPDAVRVSRFLRTYRRCIIDAVARWSGQRKYDIYTLVAKLARRSDALGLYVSRPEAEMLVDTTAFITAVINNVASLEDRRRNEETQDHGSC